jgi:hypothetical protein
MENPEQYVAIPLQIFNKVVEYLGNKPFNEVSVLMETLKENARVIETTPEQEQEEAVDE